MTILTQNYFLFTGFLFILFTMITFLSSLLTMIIILSHWKSRCRSVTNLLACNSSAALLFYSIAVSLQIPQFFQTDQQKPINLSFCKICAFVYVFACAAKSYSYLVKAMSRWFITMRYKYRLLLQIRTNIFMLIASWIISLIISGSLIFSSKAYQYEPESRLCVLTSKSFLTSFIPAAIVFLMPANIIVMLYGHMLWHIRRIHRIHPNGLIVFENTQNMKVYKNILILLGIVILGGTPYSFCVILNGISQAPQCLYSISVIFISMTAAMESLTICLMNQQVKKILYAKICQSRKRKIAIIA